MMATLKNYIKDLMMIANFYVLVSLVSLPYATTCSSTTKMSTSRSLNRRKERRGANAKKSSSGVQRSRQFS